MEHSKLNFPFDIAKFFDDFMLQDRRKINQLVQKYILYLCK
jgi:hypothetical protein